METVYIGLGSNVGDREANLCEAACRLQTDGLFRHLEYSSIFETSPVGFTRQRRFLNAVVSGMCDCQPLELLEYLKDIERKMGRRTVYRWGPRNIDCDILFFGERIIKSEELEIPHPCLHERRFVLVPLNELAQDHVHPLYEGKTVRVMLEHLPFNEKVHYYGRF